MSDRTVTEDVSNMDLGFVTELEWFDDRDDAITLTRKLWRLIEVDEVTLPDPYSHDDDEDEA